jgi:hypothetical protein
VLHLIDGLQDELGACLPCPWACLACTLCVIILCAWRLGGLCVQLPSQFLVVS